MGVSPKLSHPNVEKMIAKAGQLLDEAVRSERMVTAEGSLQFLAERL